MHGLGGLDHEICSTGHCCGLAERCLDLPVYAVRVKDRSPGPVCLDNVNLFWGDIGHVVLDVLVHRLVVHNDLVERLIEHIAQDR